MCHDVASRTMAESTGFRAGSRKVLADDIVALAHAHSLSNASAISVLPRARIVRATDAIVSFPTSLPLPMLFAGKLS